MRKELPTQKLNKRAETVLQDLVDIHTSTGTPVGSKTLTENSALGLSSASYRNIMADLEAHGYLISPHTSAGRIPTEEGYRYYAQNLVEVEHLDDTIKEKIDAAVLSGKDRKEILGDVSNLLGEMTACTGLVTAPRLDMAELDKIDFLRISDDKVMAVVVTRDGNIENRMITVPAHISVEQLNSSSDKLKDIIFGETLADARVNMMQELMEHKNQVDNLMEDMMAVADTWAKPTNTDTALVVSGTQNLFQYPELVRDQLKTLFTAFEEKRTLMALMNEVQKGQGVQVYIGADCPVDEAGGVSMISSTYGTDKTTPLGTLGVIGPVRMDYKKTIQVVNYTGKLLSKILEK